MVALYVRQSVDKADSISIETQVEHCRSRLTTAELSSHRVYADKGFSGKNTARPAFQELLRDIEAGTVDKIMVYKLDRVSRSVHDFTGLCDILRARGVAFQSCEDGLTLDDTPAGAAMAQIMMVFAQFERETIIRRVTDNYYERAKAGMYLGGRPPFGFQKGETLVGGKKTACFVPDPTRAGLVRELYAQYLEPDASLGGLMRWLAERRVPAARGGAWSTVQLGRLLRSPAYVRADALVYRYLQQHGAAMNNPLAQFDGVHGCYLYAPRSGRTRSKFSDLRGAAVSLAPHEGLVDADTWLRVQEKLSRNRAVKNAGRGTHSWLSGRMRCALCGYAVTVVNKPAPGRGHYINCGGRKKGCCPGRAQVMTLEQIESAVEGVLLPFLRRYRDVPLRVRTPPDARDNARAMQRVALEQEIAQLTANIAHITQPDVLALTADLLHRKNDALAALNAEQEAAKRPAADPRLERLFAAIPEEWPSYSLEEKKRLAALAVAHVTVGDGTVNVTFAAGQGDLPGAQKNDG